MAKKPKKIRNPLTGEKLSRERSDYVRTVREARANARRGMRSGNPAKRASAASVYVTAPRIIRAVYAQAARES